IHHGCGGSKEGFNIWRDYALNTQRAARLKHRRDNVEQAIKTEWHYAKDDRERGVLGLGSIYKRLYGYGWDEHDVILELEDGDFDEDDEDGSDDLSLGEIRRLFDAGDDEEDGDAPVDDVPAAAKEPVDQISVPKHLLTIPGILGSSVDHYNATSTQTQPQFAVQTALALGSVVLGRYWSSEFDNFTSLYLVNLGATGSGKEFSRKFLTKVLGEADLGTIMGPKSYASEAGIMGELAWKPRHVTVYDEFGKLLDSTSRSGNTNLRDAQTMLMSLFGTLDTEARPSAYSTNGKSKEQIAAMRDMVVMRPAITVLGLSTPETFFDALSQDDVANGFMNRLLVINTREPRRVEKHRRWKRIPDGLKKWMVHYGNEDGDDFLPEEVSSEVDDPEVVRFSKAASRRLHEIAQEVINLQNRYQSRRLDGMFSRSKEIAQRISLIVALSREVEEIGIEDINWAWDYVIFYTMEMVANAQDMMGAGPTARIADHLAEVIIDSGERGMAVRDLVRKSVQFKNLDERGVNEVTFRLATAHDIHPTMAKMAKGGRPTKRFIHRDFIRGRDG
ncbi:DUF3987 domain-containing protein, partial [Paraburkholderia aspalathi]|nr:DUF3987 domain-containing protein [Paraburkholderia aspalathi]